MTSMERMASLEKKREFQTPYCDVVFRQFAKEHPENKEAMRTVLKEIDGQAMENFSVFLSEVFPRVSFSFSKLTVTPELIHKLTTLNSPNPVGAAAEETEAPEQNEGAEENLNAKRHDYFLFTGFAPPPDGHALTVQDVAVDRYIRLMPRVANALKRGETPPEVNVYLLGAPTGLGGSVTPEWVQMIKENGFEKYGELYAEFIKQHEPAELAEGMEPHIVLQGVSKGAIVAERTSRYLPEKLLPHTQRLLDNPVGDHGDKPLVTRWLKAVQVVPGFIDEFVTQRLSSDVLKGLMQQGKHFITALSKKKQIPEDDTEQAKLKRRIAFTEIKTLIQGTTLDTEETRSFIRRGIDDSTTYDYARVYDVMQKLKEGKRIPFFQRGKSVEVPFTGSHMFPHLRSHHRWNTILNFSQKA